MELKALEDVFLYELAELYDVEQQLTKALPQMAKAANSSALKGALETHNKQTQHQMERLDKVFRVLGRDMSSKESKVMSELARQAQEVIALKTAEPEVRDAALITVAQRVKHYEMASYGSARSHATTMGYSKIANILQDSLNEEGQADELLTQIATKKVNVQAAKAPFAHARTAPRNGEAAGGLGLGALISGLMIGAAVALLYAPKSGESVRKDLQGAADDLKHKSERWRSSAEELIERGKQTIHEQRSKFAHR